MAGYAYLERLEELLAELPPDDRRKVLQYYEKYFETIGPEAEEHAAEALGSPAEVAAKILRKREEPEVEFRSLKRNFLLGLVALLLLFAMAVSVTVLVERKYRASTAPTATEEVQPTYAPEEE